MKIAFIGGGHIAHALIAGLYQQAEIIVAEHREDRRRALAHEFNVQAVERLPAELTADLAVLAVRPAQARAACAELPAEGLLVSVVAGLRTGELMQWTGRAAAQVVRAMPNTPVQVGQGMTFAYADDAMSAADEAAVMRLFSAVGQFIWTAREDLLDAATAVSGSGPGYIYYIIEAMCEAARQLGFDERRAQQAVLQSIRGACAMVEHNRQATPLELCEAVAVPGGTTVRALEVMQAANVDETIIKAIAACAVRARELGDEFNAEEPLSR